MNDNKSPLLTAIILGLSIVISGYFIGQAFVAGKKLDRVVTVKGLAEREVLANMASWPLELTVSGNDLSYMQKVIQDQTEKSLAFFQSQQFTDQEITVGAPNIQDKQANAYGGERYGQDRYIAKVEFNLRTTEIGKLDKAVQSITRLVGQGIVISSKNPWSPVQYSFTGLNEIKPEMVEEATKNAREVAEKFARDSGSKVGKIRNANQGQFSIFDRDPNSGVYKRVRVVSTIVYYLED